MIRLIDDYQAARRFQQRAQIIIAQHATGGIIWGADDRHFGLQVTDCIPERRDVITQVRIERKPDDLAFKHCGNLTVQSKRRLVDQHPLPLSDSDHQECLDQFIGSITGNDTVGCPSAELSQSFVQSLGHKVRITRPRALVYAP